MFKKLIVAMIALLGIAAIASPAQAGHGRSYVSIGVGYSSPGYYDYYDDGYYPRSYRAPVYFAPAYYDDYPVYRGYNSHYAPRYYRSHRSYYKPRHYRSHRGYYRNQYRRHHGHHGHRNRGYRRH
jgi:hypothetical protein